MPVTHLPRSAWHDVPIPSRLAARPRDKRDLPVPWGVLIGKSEQPTFWPFNARERAGPCTSGPLRTRLPHRFDDFQVEVHAQQRHQVLDVALPRADHIELRRQDIHGFTARPLESDDPEAAAAEYPLMAGRLSPTRGEADMALRRQVQGLRAHHTRLA